ncbi:MAG TPA: beta-ketoacyl synthase chain length factor [Steroidobacteraceae bacterium]|nr:beta-ketoacyl synthase chain length factor [Steroidobacteraceae bacterium]
MIVQAFVAGIGVLGPGLAGWAETRSVLRGERPYACAPTVLPAPTLLPAAERRRTGRVVKLALAVAAQATAHAAVEPAQLRSVFSASGGDGENCHELCQSLAAPAREVSPTRFSNSVHNAPAGYWSIATGATAPSTVLCAFDGSFCAGLLEAMVQVSVDEERILLVVYDAQYPEPMRAKRPVPDAFGAALVLTPARQPSSLARLRASIGGESIERLAQPGLEALRSANPAARALPLLRRLALARSDRTVLEYLEDSSVTVQVEPCA